MDDRFLNELRREPPPEFARSLRERLRGLEDDAPRAGFRLHQALAGVAVVIVAALLFTLPSVRAAAQTMLDLFRVRNFAAVPFDADAARTLRERAKQEQGEPGLLVFERQEVLQEPGPAKQFDSPQAAASATGLTVRTPAYLPSGFTLQKTSVMGEGAHAPDDQREQDARSCSPSSTSTTCRCRTSSTASRSPCACRASVRPRVREREPRRSS